MFTQKLENELPLKTNFYECKYVERVKNIISCKKYKKTTKQK